MTERKVILQKQKNWDFFHNSFPWCIKRFQLNYTKERIVYNMHILLMKRAIVVSWWGNERREGGSCFDSDIGWRQLTDGNQLNPLMRSNVAPAYRQDQHLIPSNGLLKVEILYTFTTATSHAMLAKESTSRQLNHVVF